MLRCYLTMHPNKIAVASEQDETHTMASSSHSKEPRLHEVFISFRGEDVRNNFVSHLHAALVDRGIRTYIDSENLNHGQTLADELPKAIEESSIAVVVLSANYGSSTWCLRELVKIMECKITSGLDVFPIFYNIDPSDVRNQNNTFFEAFSDHEKNFKDDAETVKIWRETLREVANLVGEDTRGKNELSCIKNIADEILSKLPVKASQFRKSVVGIESRISEIKKLMYSKPNEVLFIGMWGMGGIGKTTTARAIFEDSKSEFGGTCFLQDVRQSNNELKELQKNLLSDVLKTEVKVRDVVRGSSIIQERLQFKKVLLVIDDVDDIEQLNALAKECDWFGRGSVIIITTRDEHLLHDVHIKKYDVQTLPENEALHLFSLHAFKSEYPPNEYRDLSLQVLRYAGGLPLALKVLGDHLKGGGISFWKDALSRLKYAPDDKIISKLQISFDGLNVIHQNIFLNIACFFRGFLKYKVEKRLQCLGFHPEEGIDILVRRSLISINFKGYIKMHDLLQEMGWYIVRQRANFDVRRYSRLWLKEDMVEMFSDNTASSEVEGIYMDMNYRSGQRVMYWLGLEAALRKMNKLSFFELCGKHFEENYDVSVNVPQSSGQLSNNNLRWFSWSYYSGQSLPKSFRPMNLVHLSLTCSKIEETPDFSHMPNLEELDLSWSNRLVHVHPSLGDHKKIKSVYLSRCSKLEEFPRIVDMNALEELDLSFTNLKSFPEITGNVNRLVKLCLNCTKITSLPWSIGRATGLEVISMMGCESLLTLPISFLGPQLQKVDISSEVLVSFKGETGQAVELIVSEGMGQLSVLHINFQFCYSLEELPEPLLARVVSLTTYKCPSITSWICFHLVDLLDNYQHFCNLQLYEECEVPHQFLQVFPEWESVSNMMRKREDSFNLYVQGIQSPSWFQYRINLPRVTAVLPPLDEWDSDNLKGFVLSGINAHLVEESDFNPDDAWPKGHVLIMYIPIKNIRNWEGKFERTLFQLCGKEMEEEMSSWGLSLVYNEEIVNEVHPCQVRIIIDNVDGDTRYSHFRVKIAQSKVGKNG